ncbi:MAG: YihY/virulence factor BrkB family protein [Chitinophagales bacterium]|nr:YihY/virulence factor BrkB family protein [Chitinophagales bacterium]
MNLILRHLIAFRNSFINSFRLFKKHDTLTLGAALSYYTGFSLIPIIIIVLSIAGALVGTETVESEIKILLENFLGEHGAKELEDIIKVTYLPAHNKFATGIAIFLLLFGATSVFAQIHSSLNLIWNVKGNVKQPILRFFMQRIFSLATIVSLSFLLLVSLIVHSALAIFSNYLNTHLPQTSVFILKVVDFFLSYGFTTLLFAFVFKYMSDANPKWRIVFPGALFTAVLFLIGKYLMGIYLTNFNIDSNYGAAGAMVLLLIWVFYSAQIVFFGAEFIHALAAEHGYSLDPAAVRAHADKGMLHTHVLREK